MVLLIRQNNRSSQPPPALGHLGVTKAHQVPPCCNGVILDKTDDCNVQQLHKAKCTADLKTSAAIDISTAAGSQSNQTLQLSLTDISISCVTDLEITGTVHATYGLGVLSKFPLKEIDVTKASVLWDM